MGCDRPSETREARRRPPATTSASRLLAMALVGSCLLQGCYSLACVRTKLTLTCPATPQRVVVERWDIVGEEIQGSPKPWPITALLSVLYYPLDVGVSTMVAITAPFQQDLDIRFGPAGAVLGIALPGLTLFPGMGLPDYERPIRQGQMKDLLRAISEHREHRVLRQLGDLWTPRTLSIEVIQVQGEP